jgi:hypothetical protein
MLRVLISSIVRSAVAWFMCVFLIILSETASAHEPCGERCLEANKGPPGTLVSTEDLEGVLAIWNPRPETLSLGAPGTSRECDTRCARQLEIYDLDQPPIVLAETSTRQQHFYMHLGTFRIFGIAMFANNELAALHRMWWHWPVLIWGVGLGMHAFVVVTENRFLGPNWEERKVRKLMHRNEGVGTR